MAKWVVMTLIVLFFTMFTIVVILSALAEGNTGRAFWSIGCPMTTGIGKIFLAQSLLLITLVVCLFIVTKRAIRWELANSGQV